MCTRYEHSEELDNTHCNIHTNPTTAISNGHTNYQPAINNAIIAANLLLASRRSSSGAQ